MLRRWLRRLGLVVLALVLAALAWVTVRYAQRPDLSAYQVLTLPEAAAPELGALRLRFLGVSTLLLDDGQTALMTDGFFTRPGLGSVAFGRVAPDEALIRASLQRAGVQRLAALIALHSHYDHALDAPTVARLTGATLVGSPSTLNIGLGGGLAPTQMRRIEGGERLRFGEFEIEVIRSRHFPHPLAQGEITQPLMPPARADAYREGGSFNLLVRHRGRSLLIVGSAGFVEGGLAGRRAEVALLGMAGLGSKDEAYRQQYWAETQGRVHARRIIPIHWDDFTLPLNEPLQPGRLLFDDLGVTLDFMQRRALAEGVDLRFAPLWEPIDPFAGLTPAP